jgi:uncharacterized protein
MPEQSTYSDRLSAVALFPLPNVVLFPRAVLPLHIFEERYKRMTADALAGDRLVAMALLMPGWVKQYYGRAEIAPVVCVGRIISHEKLPDGKYNFLLHGETRARIVHEYPADPDERPYRIADLEPLVESEHLEIDLIDHRQRVMSMFSQDFLERLPAAREYRRLLCSALPTAQVMDLLAFHLIDDVCAKQSLLAETEVERRVVRITAMIEELFPLLEAAARQRISAPSVN